MKHLFHTLTLPPHRTELPGNILFALAYLARETYQEDKKKRMLTASQVTTLPSAKTWNQVFVQQKLRVSADQRRVWDDPSMNERVDTEVGERTNTFFWVK